MLRQPLQRPRAAAAAVALALFKATTRRSASAARPRLPRRVLCRVEVFPVADSPFLCGCTPPRRARSRLVAPPPYGPYPKPAHVYGYRIGTAKYLIKNNRPGYISQVYPMRNRGCQTYLLARSSSLSCIIFFPKKNLL
jgi:hypothetical protein